MLDRALSDSWEFFKRHLWMLAAIILPIVVPLQLLLTAYGNPAGAEEATYAELVLPMIISILVYPLYMVGVVFYIASVVTDRRATLSELWKLGVRYWAPFMFLVVLVWGAITVGTMLLIVPGIILMVRLAFAEFDLLLNQNGPLQAFKNSWRMTRGHGGAIFGGYVIITLAIYIPYGIILYLVSGTGLDHWAVLLVLNVILAVANLFYTVFAFRVFDLSQSGPQSGHQSGPGSEPQSDPDEPAEPERITEG